MRIDHIIYGTEDLDAAEAWVASRTALTAFPGGTHDGVGTHNRIVPLGDGSFIELLAVCDADQAGRSTIGAALRAGIARGEGFLGWAVAVRDLRPVVERLGASVVTVGRQGRTARLAGVSEALADPGLPFFIERPALALACDNRAEAISWIEMACDSGRLDAWLGRHTLSIRLVDGAPGIRAVGLGERELRPQASRQAGC